MGEILLVDYLVLWFLFVHICLMASLNV